MQKRYLATTVIASTIELNNRANARLHKTRMTSHSNISDLIDTGSTTTGTVQSCRMCTRPNTSQTNRVGLLSSSAHQPRGAATLALVRARTARARTAMRLVARQPKSRACVDTRPDKGIYIVTLHLCIYPPVFATHPSHFTSLSSSSTTRC